MGRGISLELPQASIKLIPNANNGKALALNGMTDPSSAILERNAYVWKDVKFTYFLRQGTLPSNFLEKLKKDMISLNHFEYVKSTSGQQVVKTINGNFFVCQISSRFSGTTLYRIECLNKSQSKGFGLTIKYPTTMEEEVMAKLEEIM